MAVSAEHAAALKARRSHVSNLARIGLRYSEIAELIGVSEECVGNDRRVAQQAFSAPVAKRVRPTHPTRGQIAHALGLPAYAI